MSASVKSVLPLSWFERSASCVARDLIGSYLCSAEPGVRLLITETESYPGPHEQATALHLTRRRHSEQMKSRGGVWYVYPVYGVHLMLNLVTGAAGEAQSVLIRAAFDPAAEAHKLCAGPAKLSNYLSVSKGLSGQPITPESGLWIERGELIGDKSLSIGSRIGIDYAGADAALPLRFGLKNHPSLSKKFT
jgi:DNA-3-methyladenine glycosylase